MANNEAGKTRVDDAHASKLSVSISNIETHKEYQCPIIVYLQLIAEFTTRFRITKYIKMEHV